MLEEDCEKWINICAFIARCIRSGLLNQHESRCGYAIYDITNGLQQYHPVEIIQRCFVIAALNYIIFSSFEIYRALCGDLLPQPGQNGGIVKWLQWEVKVQEIADSEEAGSNLEWLARIALDKMISLYPYES